MGCKLVGTVKGTKIWAGGCAAASELRGAAGGNYRRQQAFLAGGLGQEVDRAGFDGSPHCPGPLPIFPAIVLSWHPAFQLVALGINHVGRGI